MSKRILPIIIALVIIGAVGVVIAKYAKPVPEPVVTGTDKSDLIRVTSPQPNTEIASPVTITGEARGNWFFEASFPIVITDANGKVVGQGHATAKGDWMTQDFVPFEASIGFVVDPNLASNKGTIILKKDNPSGLPANDASIEIPVLLAGDTAPVPHILPGVKLGEKITINGVSITPLELIQDSRCGSGVVCVWAGTVEIKTKLESGVNSTTTTLTLNKPLPFAGKQITLEKVEPYPNGKTMIVAANYRFTFSVTQ